MKKNESVACSTAAASRSRDARAIARVGVIAAAYAACTLVAMLFLGSLAWGPVQFRVSEALCALALVTPAAVPGLTLGVSSPLAAGHRFLHHSLYEHLARRGMDADVPVRLGEHRNRRSGYHVRAGISPVPLAS